MAVREQPRYALVHVGRAGTAEITGPQEPAAANG